MIYTVQKDVATINAGFKPKFWRIYKFFKDWIPVSFTGKYIIIEESAAGGSFDSETSPGDGSFLVIQCETPFEGTTVKWQGMIGFRLTVGAIGGYANITAGLYVGLAPDGGWSTTTKTFGTSLFTGLQAIGGSNTTLATMQLWATNQSVYMIGDDGNDNTYEFGYYIGLLISGDTKTDDPKPCTLFFGNPRPGTSSGMWGATGADAGLVPNSLWTAFNRARICNDTNIDGYGKTQIGNKNIEYPLFVFNAVLNKYRGFLDLIKRCDITLANKTVNAANTRVCFHGLSYPWR